jgi:DNA-binding SARP family transcriptional activator
MLRKKSVAMLWPGANLMFTVLFVLFGHLVHGQNQKQELNYGLSFSSHEVTKDQRTSLSLTPGESIAIQGDFEIRFDLSLKRLTDAYGYVLRIIANDSLNIDMVSSPEHEEFRDLNLIINNTQTKIQFDHQDIHLEPLSWIPVVIKFDSKNNLIAVSLNGQVKTHGMVVNTLKNFRFFFGANHFGKFNTSDVPPMMIRDIELDKVNGKLIKWDLQRHGVNEVFDNSYAYAATVKNPTWLIDKHISWVHEKEFSIGKYPSVAFNSNSGIMYASDKNSLHTLAIGSSKTEQHQVRQGNVFYTDANQMLFIEETNKLINYDLHTNGLTEFSFEQKKWANKDTTYNEPNYWHNNKFYNPLDKSVYTFGGYGHFSYKNKFMRYDDNAHQWVEVKTNGTIPPRYLGALGLSPKKEKAYIFGGYGSESGKQELFPQSYADLYTFDLRTHEVKKLWELKSDKGEEDIVFSNSLVINEKDSCFYVLSFPKNKHDSFIKLRKYSLIKPEVEILADSIPFQFHDEHSFCDLFLSRPTGQLVAVTSHKEKEDYRLNIYTVNYPPLNTSEVFQNIPRASTSNASLYIIIGSVIFVCGVGGYFIIKSAKQKTAVPATQYATSQETPHKSQVNDADVIKALPEPEKVVSAVYLFGGFQVFDKQGNDITGKFTGTLKELFVLILLHSVKFEKGVSTTLLQEHLWPDKDEMSARNNRNVNIKKLRGLLEEVDGITIENNNAYLQLVINSNVICDYHIVSKILANTGAIEGHTIELLMKYVKRGNLLPNLQTPWLDNFKSDISNKIIDALLEYSQRLDVNKDDRILLEIADTIFNYDTINQEALVIKCSVLNKKGKYSLAKTWYDHFVKEYKTLYAESYPKTFDEVIS